MLTENLLHDDSAARALRSQIAFWGFLLRARCNFFERIISGFPSGRYALFLNSLTMPVLAVQLERHIRQEALLILGRYRQFHKEGCPFALAFRLCPNSAAVQLDQLLGNRKS